MRAGKHVYVQKTMATTYDEAREMVETANANGLTLVAAPGQMLAPANQAMKELVSSGALGDVYWAWGSTGGWSHEESTRRGEGALGTVDPTWYFRPAGGPLRDVTVYVLHSLTGILGPAQRVTALSGVRVAERQWRDKTIPVEVDDNSVLLLDFGNATFAMAGGHSSRTGQLMQWGSMGIYGLNGAIETLEIEPLSGHPTRLYISARMEPPSTPVFAGGRRRILHHDHLAALRDSGPRRHPGAARLRRHHARRRLHRAGQSPTRLRRTRLPRGRNHRKRLPRRPHRPDPNPGEPILKHRKSSANLDLAELPHLSYGSPGEEVSAIIFSCKQRIPIASWSTKAQ